MRFPQSIPYGSSSNCRRKGLAPVELVLWLPILLFVTALIVNFGTAAAWRVRGEISSRDAADRQVAPRTGRNEPRQENWPVRDAMVFSESLAETNELLDIPQLQHPVVRGPIGNGFTVWPSFDADAIGWGRGESQIERTFPLLPALGSYQSGPIQTPQLSDSGSIARSYFRGLLPIPHEALLDSASWEPALRVAAGEHFRATVSNETRRTKLLYELPDFWNDSAARFVAAMRILQALVHDPAWDVMDADSDFIRFRGSAPNFYPNARRPCESELERIRRFGLERHVTDWIDPRRGVQLGGVSQLPATLTSRFLALYQSEREVAREEGNGALVSELEAKIGQLEAYRGRWNNIQERLKQNSPVAR